MAHNYFSSHAEQLIAVVESFGEKVSHQVCTPLGEMDIVFSSQTLFNPLWHGVFSSHGMEDAPKCDTVTGSRGGKAVDEAVNDGIGLQLPI